MMNFPRLCADIDNPEIVLNQLINYIVQIPKQNMTLEKLFRKLDKNGKNFLNFNDFKTLESIFYFGFSDRELNDIFNVWGGRSQKISFQEFKMIFQSVKMSGKNVIIV